MKPRPAQTWVVKRFENGSALLVANGQELTIARSQLPPKIKEGDVVTAEFYLVKDEPARKENLARALLEEILGKE